MPRKSPGAKTKGLGGKLRAYRQRAGMTIEGVSEATGLGKNVLSRLELGQRHINEHEVVQLAGLYQVGKRELADLVTMVRTLSETSWWEGATGLTQESATLARYESTASKITSWAPLLPPGLLQTEDFSRGFMLDDGIDPSDIKARVEARLKRQERLRKGSFKYLALIGEPALIGNDATHRDQLSALIAASERSNVTVRVVPTRLIPRQGRRGAFLVLQSPTETVVHVELARTGAFLDEEPFITPYLRSVSRLSEVALGETESRRWITDVRDRMEI